MIGGKAVIECLKAHILTLSGLRRLNRQERRMLGNYW